MESTAVGILRKELEASNGLAPMSSLSVRVKWGQGDLAQLGNFRTFLKKQPQVFSLESNTVHLVDFVPKLLQVPVDDETAVTEGDHHPTAETNLQGEPAATASFQASAAVSAPNGMVTPADAALVPGVSKSGVVSASVGLSKAAFSHASVGVSKAAVSGAASAAIAQAKGPPAPKIGLPRQAMEMKSGVLVPPKKRPVADSHDDRESKVPRKTTGNEMKLGSASKAPMASCEQSVITSKAAAKSYGSVPNGNADKISHACKFMDANGEDVSEEAEETLGSSHGKAPTPSKAGASVVVPVPPKNKALATAVPSKSVSTSARDAEGNPFVKAAALRAPTFPESEGDDNLDVEGSVVAKGQISVPKKITALPLPGRNGMKQFTALNKASDDRPPLQGKNSLMGRLAPKQGEVRPGYGVSLAKDAAVKALEPKQPNGPPTQAMSDSVEALTASQAKRPALHMAQAKQLTPRPSVLPDAMHHQEQTGRLWKEDDLSDTELAKAISDCKSYGIELELIALAKQISPSDEYQRACQRSVALLRSAVNQQWVSTRGSPAPLIELCGSHAQGMELDGADLDVAMRLAPGFAAEDRNEWLEELQGKLRAPPQSAFLTLADEPMRVFPHAAASLSMELKGNEPHTIAHLVVLEQAVAATERSHAIDSVVKQLTDACEASRDLIRLVKLWASNHGLLNAYDGAINGLAWTLLVIFFLQKERLIPPYAALAHGAVVPSLPHPLLSSLLRGFFEFLAARGDKMQCGLSVTHATEYRAPSGVLFLEDPAEFAETRQQRNLAETLSEAQWVRIMDEARRAAERLNARPQRWFHWAEIFDSRELPPERIARLQPLAETGACIAELQVEGTASAMAQSQTNSGAIPKMEAAAPSFIHGEVGNSKGSTTAPPIRSLSTTVARPSGKGFGQVAMSPPTLPGPTVHGGTAYVRF